jgi:hypothetical protein
MWGKISNPVDDYETPFRVFILEKKLSKNTEGLLRSRR